MNMHKTFVLSVFLMFVAMLAAVPASADVANFTLNYGNAAFCGGSGPSSCATFGNVNMELNADKTITVSVTVQDPYTLWGAGQAAFAFNYSGTGTLSVSNITSGVSNWSFAGPGSTSMDGFGKFDYVLSNTPGSQDLGKTLVFTVSTDATGGFTSVQQLNVAGNNGYSLAAHVWGNPGGGAVTGFAGAGPNTPPPVPEPASIALIGSGLAVLGGYMRKRNSKR